MSYDKKCPRFVDPVRGWVKEQVASLRPGAAPKQPGQNPSPVCYACGAAGHMRKDCPRPNSSADRRVAFVGTEESANPSGSEEEATLRPGEEMVYYE